MMGPHLVSCHPWAPDKHKDNAAPAHQRVRAHARCTEAQGGQLSDAGKELL